MGLKMNNWQKVINVSLAVIVTLLIYQNQQLQKEVDSVAGFNELDSNAIWNRMDKIEEKAYANKSELQDCIDIGYKGVPNDERAWTETHEKLFNQCTNYLNK